jgi:2-dehydro-3-deoxyphosphogluconate aldolase/(4S)-4-hydroxy-2-oxoglutarate aldolase
MMARFSRLEVYNEILRVGILPIFYHPDFNIARSVIEACASGGAQAFEFTNRGDNAFQVFSELNAHFARTEPSLVLGVGSVVDGPTAALFIACGANFVVGPMFNPEVAILCNRHKIPYIPGCADATQISQAEELGVEFAKVFFRDSQSGQHFIRTHLLAMPWTRFVQTGGVEITELSISSWFEAGVSVVGFGSKLFRKDLMDGKDYDGIRALASKAVSLVGAVHSASAQNGNAVGG